MVVSLTEGVKVQCPYCEKVISSATGLDLHLHDAHFDKTSDLHWPENAFYINEAEEEEKRRPKEFRSKDRRGSG